jgi:peptide/nickel transport system substrate-binding protein
MKLFRIAAAAALFALACGTAAAQSTLRIGLAEDPDILDPTLARTYVGRIVFASICDKLFDIDEKLNVVPQLALSHETSADGKAVTIKLRPGVKFQDGEAFDAEAAKYSLMRHLTMPGSFRRTEIAAIDHVDVVDPLTIRIILKTPYAPLIAQLTDRAGMMLAPKAAQAAADKFGLHPVCAGPYRFVERVQQDHIAVEKFADYWNKDSVHVDRIVYQTVVDASVRLASLKSGGLDIAERLLATDIRDIRADKRLKLETALWLGYQGIDINVGDNPHAKATPLGRLAKVRQALGFAIDRDAINQVVFNGEFVAGNQWVNPDNPFYQKSFPVPARDVAKAKALMAEAGVTTPFAVDFMVPKGDENQAIAEMIQAMAKDIGIDMKIRVTEFATSLKQAEAGEYQAFLLDWSGRTDIDGNVYNFYICKGPLGYTQFCNPEADKLLNEARTISDFAARKAVYEKLTRLIQGESPIIYLYHRKILMGVSTRVDGYRQVPDGMIRVVGLRLK